MVEDDKETPASRLGHDDASHDALPPDVAPQSVAPQSVAPQDVSPPDAADSASGQGPTRRGTTRRGALRRSTARPANQDAPQDADAHQDLASQEDTPQEIEIMRRSSRRGGSRRRPSNPGASRPGHQDGQQDAPTQDLPQDTQPSASRRRARGRGAASRHQDATVEDQDSSIANNIGQTGTLSVSVTPDRALLRAAGAMQEAKGVAPARIASWLLFATAAFAPLPFGSTEPTAVAFWCIALGVCLIFAPLRNLSSGQLALAGLAGIVVAAYALVLHEQLAEHPWFAKPDPIWHEAAAALGMPLAPSVSIARGEPWFELGRPLVCVLALACGFLVGVDAGRARQLMKVIAWSGAAYAAYGILAHLFDPSHILWLPKGAYLDSVTGTFINQNTAAAYFGSCAVVWSVLLWERARWATPVRPLRWRIMFARLFASTPKRVVTAFVMLLLCLLAMFMTGSRAGVVVSLLALIIAFTAYFRRDLPRRSGLVTAFAGAGAAALITLQLMGGAVNTRFDVKGLADEGRFAAYRSTLRMIADHPWFGTGQGTFAYAFPAYRSPQVSVWGTWDMAHNSVLQIASDMGVPIAALVVAGWMVIFGVLIRGTLVRRRDLVVPVAALAVASLGALHSMVDFTLQIPGYAVVALSLIGAGLAQSFTTRPKSDLASNRHSSSLAGQSR